jgi:hypothetical protein
MIVSFIRIVLGFVAAMLVAGAVQVLFVAGDEIVSGSVTSARLEALGLLTLLAATQSAVFSAPFAFLAAAVAAWRPIKSSLFFICVGIAIALASFLVQYVGEGGPSTILNRYALAAYVASGLVGGWIYWLVAVPKARPSAA